MDASEGLGILPAIQNITIFTLLLGILNDVNIPGVLAVTAEIPETVTQGRSQTLENRGQKQPFSSIEPVRADIDELVWIW